MSKPEFFVGIDVAQPHLDVAIAVEDAVWRVSYDAAGLTELCARLAAAAPAQVVMEATGGLETEVAVALSAAGLAVAAANPRQERDFARATGPWAKTDALDAQVLARCSAVIQPPTRPLPDRQTRELRDLVATRRHLAAPSGNPRPEIGPAPYRVVAGRTGTGGPATAGPTPGSSRLAAAGRPPGVGPVLTSVLLAKLPAPRGARAHCTAARSRPSSAWPHSTATVASSEASAPGTHAVGGGGRAQVRTALYMATLTATRYNPVIRGFYRHLCALGKPKKIALIAAMRKLLTIHRAMIKARKPWIEDHFPLLET